MFSPYYRLARRSGGGDPMNHCAINVSLHGPRANRWAFTERGRNSVERAPAWLQVGPSSLSWSNDALRIDLNERTAWNPARLQGVVTVRPQALTGAQFTLDQAGRHRWSPLAPRSRVEVALHRPALHWQGDGYLDTNSGDAPLEQDFAHWHWSCARLRREAAILYDVTRRDGSRDCLSLAVSAPGEVSQTAPPPIKPLPKTAWRLRRETRSDGAVKLRDTLLDSPFYARSTLSTTMLGEPATAMHESLDMDRFTAPVVQAMLPFRVPRRWP